MAPKNVKLAAKDAADQLGEDVKNKLEEEYKNLADGAFKQGASVKTLTGVSDAKEEAVYGRAYLLYNTGRYKESSELFRILITLNSMEPKYMVGLAACNHMLKEYEVAAGIYTLAGVLDPNNPVPHFHLYDCYMKMNDELSAKLAIKAAVDKSRGKPEFKTLFERCEITLKGIEENEAKSPKENGAKATKT